MNIGRYFYKEIDTESDIESLLSETWNNHVETISKLKHNARLISTAIYSANVGKEGMLVGSSMKPYGAAMENNTAEKENNDLKLGMYFDHTTGLPFVKGHGIKGPLKVFLENTPHFICSRLSGSNGKEDIEAVNKAVSFLRAKNYSVFSYVTFHDVIPVQNNAMPVFMRSTFTPHKKEIYKNPIPLVHLRVHPGSTYWFPMDIRHEKVDKALSLIFPAFLEYQGVGSHTSYNLGLFTDVTRVN